MWHRNLLILGGLAWLSACTTPYNTPVVVHDSDSFPGIAEIMDKPGKAAVDVVLVHGMCTRDAAWARNAIDRMARTIDPNYQSSWPAPTAAAGDTIDVVQAEPELHGRTVRLTALVWSPMTAELKKRVAYDVTDTPNDCSQPGNTEQNCKPKRARYNGQVKDALLNDCLIDAMIYQGSHHRTMRGAMVQAMTQVLTNQENRAGGEPGPLVVVSESLGSKLVFDALGDMLQRPKGDPALQLAQRAVERLGLVFMGANPMPILGMADQAPGPAAPSGGHALPSESLQRFLALRSRDEIGRRKSISRLKLVAFTDPNDLLSYRLLRADYVSADVELANVLVSNRPTWLGLLEDPLGAHIGYLENPDVNRLIVSGWSKPAQPRSDAP